MQYISYIFHCTLQLPIIVEAKQFENIERNILKILTKIDLIKKIIGTKTQDQINHLERFQFCE